MTEHSRSAVSRRTFCRAAGAVAAAAPFAAGVAGAAADEPTRRIRKAVKFGMVQVDAPVLDRFKLLSELGFDGVEVDGPSGLDQAEVLAAQDATGLDVHGVVCSEHWRSPLSHPDEAVRAKCRAAMSQAIADAKAYGATSVLLVPGVVNKEIAYEDALTRSRDEIKQLLPEAEAAGVTIAFENVWNNFLLSPVEARDYVDGFGSKNVGWYFDVGNIVNYGWPEHWIRTLGSRITKVDVKEYSRRKRDDEGLWKGFNVALLEGDCDWPAVMRELDAIGFEGWFTAEIGGGGRERLAEIAERMDRIVAG